MTDAPLLGPDGTVSTSSANVPKFGYIVTNHLNALYILSAGLIIPPSGFGDKYYSDTLGCSPGWIPFFVGRIPREAIEISTKDFGYLKPCILMYRLSGLSGKAFAYNCSSTKEIHFPQQFDDSDRVLYFPAPLPTSRIESVLFQTQDQVRECKADAKDFNNVPIGNFVVKSNKTKFTKHADYSWPPGNGPGERPVPVQTPLAVGGAMAMFLHFAHVGQLTVDASRVVFDPEIHEVPTNSEFPILTGLSSWAKQGSPCLSTPPELSADRIAFQNASQAHLLWGIVERLVEWRKEEMVGNSQELVIELLAHAIPELDPKLQKGVGKLHDTLVSLDGLGGPTVSQMFDGLVTPLARALILYFLRSDCSDLYDFKSDRLTEPDWLVAALLFGIRDGWMNLPLRLRGGKDLSDAVSHRMARLSHRISNTELDLGTAPPRVRSLREMFGDGTKWNTRVTTAALELARLQNWDCVKTRIWLAKGQFPLIIKTGSVCIEVPGEPKISSEVDIHRFLDLLSGTRLNFNVDSKIRNSLPS